VCGCALLASLGSLVLAHTATADDDPLAPAVQLYRNAAYEEALNVLERIATDPISAKRTEANAYRAFCLIALGRTEEARTAIERVLDVDPFYQLSPEDVSPRIQSVFSDVRQAALPSLVARSYTQAKAAFERHDQDAGARFQQVLRLLDEPRTDARPEFSDLRVTTTAFLDLINASPRSSPPPKESSVPAGPTPVSATSAPVRPAVTSAPSTVIYLETDRGVVAPVLINQTIPRLQAQETLPAWRRQGRIELVIDENGGVFSAHILTPIHPVYDQALVKSAMGWRYLPARKDGTPVRVRKIVTFQIVPN